MIAYPLYGFDAKLSDICGAGCCRDGSKWRRQDDISECIDGHGEVWHHFWAGVGEWACHEDVQTPPHHGLRSPGHHIHLNVY